MAREIEFSIDAETGELTTHIRGIAGPACEDVAKLVEEYVGQPTSEARTAEYAARTRIQPKVRGRHWGEG
jgi:hypothetical protein